MKSRFYKENNMNFILHIMYRYLVHVAHFPIGILVSFSHRDTSQLCNAWLVNTRWTGLTTGGQRHLDFEVAAAGMPWALIKDGFTQWHNSLVVHRKYMHGHNTCTTHTFRGNPLFTNTMSEIFMLFSNSEVSIDSISHCVLCRIKDTQNKHNAELQRADPGTKVKG